MAWNPFKRKTAEDLAAEKKKFEEKIDKMKQSIENFKGKLSEDFILGDTMAEEFRDSFDYQLNKQGSSATKRWCQDVDKKLAKLDESNKKFSKEHAWTFNETAPCGVRLKDEDKKALKAKNIEEFRKIFHTTTAFDNSFFGTEVKVKATFSQKAAVNEVKKELNDLCNPNKFKPKA